MADYTKGIRIKTIQGRYGEFMSVGINVEDFKSNPINERGYVNFRISKSRNGDWYAVNDDRASVSNNNEVENKEVNESKDTGLGEEELPF